MMNVKTIRETQTAICNIIAKVETAIFNQLSSTKEFMSTDIRVDIDKADKAGVDAAATILIALGYNISLDFNNEAIEISWKKA